eukprot:TRINITY_DN923_c2_g3_i1.p1 TRINITY_DN923_c2_g3~~TRINITY_DN923_c2_g3_i1.p1  ORF type:complete len:258 (+),score=78.99 TRINITY_DN923_c2_g3_i1:43-816(+)
MICARRAMPQPPRQPLQPPPSGAAAAAGGGGAACEAEVIAQLTRANCDLASRCSHLKDQLARSAAEAEELRRALAERSSVQCPRCREAATSAARASEERDVMLERLREERRGRRELRERCRELEELLTETRRALGRHEAAAEAAAAACPAGRQSPPPDPAAQSTAAESPPTPPPYPGSPSPPRDEGTAAGVCGERARSSADYYAMYPEADWEAQSDWGQSTYAAEARSASVDHLLPAPRRLSKGVEQDWGGEEWLPP